MTMNHRLFMHYITMVQTELANTILLARIKTVKFL